MALDTIGSIANFLQTSFANVPDGMSGANMVAVVDMNRQHVANFTGQSIGSNSISEEFQPAIVNFSKADILDFIQGQGGYNNLSLDELSMKKSNNQESSKFWKDLAESQLNSLGMTVSFAKSLS